MLGPTFLVLCFVTFFSGNTSHSHHPKIISDTSGLHSTQLVYPSTFAPSNSSHEAGHNTFKLYFSILCRKAVTSITSSVLYLGSFLCKILLLYIADPSSAPHIASNRFMSCGMTPTCTSASAWPRVNTSCHILLFAQEPPGPLQACPLQFWPVKPTTHAARQEASTPPFK